MAALRLLPEAVADIYRLDSFLRDKSPKAADTVSRRIDEALSKWERFPRLGRPLEDHVPFREIVVPHGSGGYVIRYRLVRSDIVVVRVWHSRELRD